MRGKKLNTIILVTIILGFVLGLGLWYARYTDMIDNSDVSSFVGSIFGSLISVFGALCVMYIERKKEKEKCIEKLMDMFKHTYIWIYPRYYIGAYNDISALNQPIVPLIYDEKWKEYIIQIDDTHHKRFLLSWFYTLDSLENKNEFIARVKENQLDEVKNILKHYRMYDNEVKKVEENSKSEYAKGIKDRIKKTQSILDKRLDDYMEEQEAREKEYLCEVDEYVSYEEQLNSEIRKLIRQYDLEILNNSMYKFN